MAKTNKHPFSINLNKKTYGYNTEDRVENAMTGPEYRAGLVKFICPKTGIVLKVIDPFKRTEEELRAKNKGLNWCF